MDGREGGDRTGRGPTVIGAVRTVLFGRERVTTVDECRRCGTSLESAATSCPHCDSEDVVTYRIE